MIGWSMLWTQPLIGLLDWNEILIGQKSILFLALAGNVLLVLSYSQ